jgi:PAS domain S-box-containing protein/diguanylate cyclase (GGDEF)-like protein
MTTELIEFASGVDPVADLATIGALVDLVHAGVAVAREGRYLFVNAHLAGMLGYRADELNGLDVAFGVVHPLDREEVRARAAARRPDLPDEAYDLRMVRKDGTTLHVRACGRRILYEQQPADLLTIVDTTQVGHAPRLSDWKARTLARTETLCASGSAEIDLLRGRWTLSEGMWRLLGIAGPHDLVSRRRALASVPEEDRRAIDAAWRGARAGEPFDLWHRIRHADGHLLTVHQRGLILSTADRRASTGVAIVQDVTAQHDAERRIEDLATLNPVSGLPNRSFLLDRIAASLTAPESPRDGLALLTVGIPQVKQVRDSLGYALGDALEAALAARLAQIMLPGELLAHLGDGDFAILMGTRASDGEDGVLDLARRFKAALAHPEQIGDTEVFPTHAIGLACWSDGLTGPRLLECARSAMQQELREPAGGVRVFSSQSNQALIRRMSVEAALRHALERDELELQYQPQVDLRTGTMCSVEALLRWRSATIGEVLPSEFIPVAEHTGLIVSIGAWVLTSACRQASEWRRAGMEGLRVHVNISAIQLARTDVARQIQSLLSEYGLEPGLLGIEVTESVLTRDLPTASRALGALRALGVKISLDDFGIGYSNLTTLKSLPIDVIKIDRSYVHDIMAPPEDVSVTRAVITLAHSLHMKVIAEGVETSGQLALLIANRCDMMQGHFFSQAVPAGQIAALWRDGRTLPMQFVDRAARQRTLLLVDDEENILASLKRLLRRSGYRIVTAPSAAEGLMRLSEVDVDVIVSDQRMPGMTGVEFLRRAKELYPETIRIVLSGYTELQSISDAINEGAIYKFLTKPWEDDLLRANIEEAFRQKEIADENRRLDKEVRAANLELASVNERLQRALASQLEQVSLAEGRSSGAREALFGLDDDGMIAIVNAECANEFVELPGLLGGDARTALPAEFLPVVEQADGRSCRFEFDGRAYRGTTRSMSSDGARGRLICITPLDVPPGRSI